jgi:hypothetical protein
VEALSIKCSSESNVGRRGRIGHDTEDGGNDNGRLAEYTGTATHIGFIADDC